MKNSLFSDKRLNIIKNDHGFDVIALNERVELPFTEGYPPIVQAIYSSLFTDKPVIYDRKELLSLVFVEQTPFLMQKMRELLQATLLKLFDQLKSNEAHEFLIGHILSYLPFFAIQEGEILKIPVSVEGNWKLAAFKARRIILTPAELGSPVTAIGLDASDAPALLLFKGTSYPSDEGFILGLLTDLNPGASVGSYLFYLGKEAIRSWLDVRKVKVYGLSLGGSMALHTAVAFPENIEAVFAFNPSALFPSDLRNYKGGANVHVICNENDAVPASGFVWGKDWNLYRIFLERKIPFLMSHYKCFLTRENFLMLKIDRAKDQNKWSRILIAYAHILSSILLFPIGLLALFYQNFINHFASFFKRS